MGFKVATSSGEYLNCQHKCSHVLLNIQGHNFTVDLYVLDIKGADVVLGVQWLVERGALFDNAIYI